MALSETRKEDPCPLGLRDMSTVAHMGPRGSAPLTRVLSLDCLEFNSLENSVVSILQHGLVII